MTTPKTSPTRTVVMTGASRGLGRRAAIDLLHDHDVHLIALARSGTPEVTADLREASGNPNVTTVTADLASMASIRAVAAAVRDQLAGGDLPPLTGFVGNAGLQLTRATQASVDGTEVTFAVNVLANYVLIDELREVFTAPARIVLTTSDTHFGDFRHNMGMVPAPTWREPHSLAQPGTADNAASTTAGHTAYSTSKLAVIYLTHALARRLPAGVKIYAFNPGLVPGTGLVRDSGPVTRFLFRAVMPAMTRTPFARTMATSGHDLAAAATAPITAPSGSYLNGTQVERSSDQSYDQGREDTLWDELTRLATTPPVLRP